MSRDNNLSGVAEYKEPDDETTPGAPSSQQIIIRNNDASEGIPIPPATWLAISTHLDPISAARLLLLTSKVIPATIKALIDEQLKQKMFADGYATWLKLPPSKALDYLHRYVSCPTEISRDFVSFVKRNGPLHLSIREGKFEDFFNSFTPKVRAGCFSFLFGNETKKPILTTSELFNQGNGALPQSLFSLIAILQPQWLPVVFERIVLPQFHYEINLSRRDENGATIFHWACACGNLEIFKSLLPFADDGIRQGAISYAVQGGRTEIVSRLLDIKETAYNHIANNLLYLASKYGYADIVKLLLKKYHYILIKNALLYPIMYGHTGIVSLLLNDRAADALTSLDTTNCLESACRFGQVKVVKMLVDIPEPRKANINERVYYRGEELYYREPALFTAVENRHKGCVAFLLKREEINPNVPYKVYSSIKAIIDQDTALPIQVAIYNGFTEIAEMLLAHPDTNIDIFNDAAYPVDRADKIKCLLQHAHTIEQLRDAGRKEGPISALIDLLNGPEAYTKSMQLEYLIIAFTELASRHRTKSHELKKISNPTLKPLMTETTISKLLKIVEDWDCEEGINALSKLSLAPDADEDAFRSAAPTYP
ncbi:MAG: ankyrin repeat domain-containing protein [Coxiellaceae bacterium]|nr:ankyrin repeat domain-containing protein [Coxiellaceae bacterium]